MALGRETYSLGMVFVTMFVSRRFFSLHNGQFSWQEISLIVETEHVGSNMHAAR
jgi:hypothetical protein